MDSLQNGCSVLIVEGDVVHSYGFVCSNEDFVLVSHCVLVEHDRLTLSIEQPTCEVIVVVTKTVRIGLVLFLYYLSVCVLLYFFFILVELVGVFPSDGIYCLDEYGGKGSILRHRYVTWVVGIAVRPLGECVTFLGSGGEYCNFAFFIFSSARYCTVAFCLNSQSIGNIPYQAHGKSIATSVKTLWTEIGRAEIKVVGVVRLCILCGCPVEAVCGSVVYMRAGTIASCRHKDSTGCLHLKPFRYGISVVRIMVASSAINAHILIPFHTLLCGRRESQTVRGSPVVRQQNKSVHTVHRTHTEESRSVLASVYQINPFLSRECVPYSRFVFRAAEDDDIQSPVGKDGVLAGVRSRLGGFVTCSPSEEVYPAIVRRS